MTLREMLDQLGKTIEIFAEFPIYTERLPDKDDNKDGAVWVNDDNLWEVTDKEVSINIVMVFRFHLKRMIAEGAKYYESNAQNEVLDILGKIINQSISPGLTLTHDKTNCFADNEGRYIIRTELSGYKGG